MPLKKFLFGVSLIAAALLIGCYYKYSYKLIESKDVKIDRSILEIGGIELIKFFDEKYIYVLGVVDKEDNIILFNKHYPVSITPDLKILASSMDGNDLEIELSKVKYFYVKRRMPYTEEESDHP